MSEQIQINKAQVFKASLDSSLDDIQERVKDANFKIMKNNIILKNLKPELKGNIYEATYSFDEPGIYAAVWEFDFGDGVKSVKKDNITVYPDLEVRANVEYSSSVDTGKTTCQCMAEDAILKKIPHYHGAFKLDKEDYEHMERYKGKNGFFMKKFLINDKFNLNNWKVTWEAITNDIWDFIGKPVVLTPEKDHPTVSEQEDFRVGTIIDIGIDEINHKAWQVSEIFDKKAQDMILNKEVEFGSPTVLIRSEHTREQKFKDTPQQQDILHRFQPAHDAIVESPAYGKQVDNIAAVCTGDGPACALKLLEVSASTKFREYAAAAELLEADYAELEYDSDYGRTGKGTHRFPIGSPQDRQLHVSRVAHSHILTIGRKK